MIFSLALAVSLGAARIDLAQVLRQQ